MSIIPGIEIAAPERTETRSGCGRIAEPLPGTLPRAARCDAHLVVEAGRHRLAGRHVGAAGVGRDREPGRHRHAERSHLRQPDTLAAEELAAPARVLVEIEDVVHETDLPPVGRTPRSRPVPVRRTVCEDAAVQGHVVAMGGFDEALIRFAVELSGAARPRVLFVPTAIADAAEVIADFYETAAERHLDPDHLELFGVPDDPLRRIERAEVILVNGGNTANMLAVWRVHGVDSALLAAWQRGAVLVGWSAGANCWFESSVTDSFGATLGPFARRARAPRRELLPSLRRGGAQTARTRGARRHRPSAAGVGLRRCRRCALLWHRAWSRRSRPARMPVPGV